MAHPVQLDYSGERYRRDVPDTLDLAERAAMAINGIGGSILAVWLRTRTRVLVRVYMALRDCVARGNTDTAEGGCATHLPCFMIAQGHIV